jgi:hypothetical protein
MIMSRVAAVRLAALAAVLAVVSVAAQTGCAPTAGNASGPVPGGDVDPTTGVARANGDGVPFYPGDIALRSVPSMPRVPKRDPEKPMALWQEELIGRQGAHLFVRNDGTVPMRIAKVSVYECVNIDGGCVEYDPNLVLQPGEKQRLYTVVPLQTNKTYRYRWRAWGGPERQTSTQARVPNVGRNPASVAQNPPSSVNPSVGSNASSAPPRTAEPPTVTPSRPMPGGLAPYGFTSSAKGNPMDTQGATIEMKAEGPTEESVTSSISVVKVRSRRMRLSADVATTDVKGGVTLWIQTESPSGNVTTESSEATRATGTKTSHLTVTASIPANATKVLLGAKIKGSGDVHITAFKFREVTTPGK